MRRVIILGAGGRDFHNFNVFFRDNPDYRVVAFTAAQIPFIENRLYPPDASGRFYPEGIPIYPEERLFEIIEALDADLVVFSYSDISHEDIMHRVSSVMASGMDFMFLGPDSTMLKSKKPVISVCAVRTGCGKSAMTRKIAAFLKENKLRVSVIRHPMAYCDFKAV
ncbi:MAG: GTPase, partial [Nitrospirae bacterium]|nr:GTPase [Nitrospirota bacterium]